MNEETGRASNWSGVLLSGEALRELRAFVAFVAASGARSPKCYLSQRLQKQTVTAG